MPDRTPVIVAGVSEPGANDPTLLVATEVARAAGAELHLVHACQLPPLMTMSPGLEMAFPEGAARYATLLAERLEAAARALPGGASAKCRVVVGGAAQVLTNVATEVGAELVIVGAARGSRLGRAILGTTAQRVLRQSRTPVLVARRPVTPPLRRVLLTTDLTVMSAAVHETALRTVDTFFGVPGEMRSLLVLGWPGVIPAPLDTAALDRAARAELVSFLAGRRGRPVQPVVRTGLVADEIVGEARDWDADLLVVGTHARGWGARMMLGSVAEAALRDAPCNVLAVPPIPAPTEAAASVAAPEAATSWAESPELDAFLGAGI